jgi:hypothetical protein
MSEDRDTVYERLHILRKKLDDEGAHVRANTVTLAINLLDDLVVDLTAIHNFAECSDPHDRFRPIAKMACSALLKIEAAT